MDENPGKLVLARDELRKRQLGQNVEGKAFKTVLAKIENTQSAKLAKARGESLKVVSVKVKDLKISETAEARLESTPEKIATKFEISQWRDLRNDFQTIIRKSVGRLRLR